MDKDFPSDSDESDDDFCPGNVDSDDVSDEESHSSGQESDDNKAKSKLNKTPKSEKNKSKIRRRKKPDNLATTIEKDEQSKNELESVTDDETEKKRSDALWSDFLSDVDGSSKDIGTSHSVKVSVNTNQRLPASESISQPPEKVTVTEIFDFAGEEVKVTKEVALNSKEEDAEDKQKPKQPLKDSTKLKCPPLKRPAGGLSSVLNAINKKGKISVLEKSKMDWDSFKKREGLSEELTTHNRGRGGYLERQDFLERTDLRQFEIEKSLRQSRKSNR